MNVGGVFMLSFIGSLAQSAAAQAAFAISYTQLFSLITWTSIGLMGAAAAVAGQNLGAGKPGPRRAKRCTSRRGSGSPVAAFVGALLPVLPAPAARGVRHERARGRRDRQQLLRVLSVSGLLITVALTYTGACRARATPRVRSYISIVSQILVPLGICFVIQQTGTLQPLHIWIAILVGHATRCVLSVLRFNQGKWRGIAVDIGPG